MDILEQMPILNDLTPEMRDLLLQALLLVIVLALVWVLRRVITAIVMRPLRGLAKRTKTATDDQILDAVVGPIRIAIIAIAIVMVIAVLDFGTALTNISQTASRSLIIAAIAFALYNIVDIIAFTPNTLLSITGLRLDERLLPFLRTIVKGFILVMGGLIIIQEWGYNVTGLIASFGVVGLAFSLAAQDTASNVFGFTAIVSDNPFNIGDYIVTADFAGVVEHVGVRSTRVRKLDQSLVTVPNSALTNAAVTNWSRLSKRRLDFVIGLTYDSTSQQMRQIVNDIRDLLTERDHIEEGSVVVHFVTFGDSALEIRIICNILLPDWGQFTAETEQINLAIMDMVEADGLSMAFPSRSLYIETLPQDLLPQGSAQESTTPEPKPEPPSQPVSPQEGDVDASTVPPSEVPNQANE